VTAMWATDVTFLFVHAPDGQGVHGNSDMSAAVSTRVFGVVRIATQVHQYPGISCEFGLVTFGCAQSTPPANIISTAKRAPSRVKASKRQVDMPSRGHFGVMRTHLAKSCG
jgi:hypothetical protein